MTVRRPVLRWHGGKWKLAPWIIGHFPKHRVYVEPFGGAASVLLRKPRSYAEVYNDLDGDVVNLFKVLRSEAGPALVDLLRLTPFARDEFALGYESAAEPVERARRLIVRSFMGFGSNSHARVTGFRANSNRSGTTPARDWTNFPDCLAEVIERFAGVVVENKDAKAVMAQHDAPGTLHYVDPPYVLSTRSDMSKDYAVEMSDAEHETLLAFLGGLSGMVVLSGYGCPLYDKALAGWNKTERALADGARKRTECLWLNKACTEALGHGPLFVEVAE